MLNLATMDARLIVETFSRGGRKQAISLFIALALSAAIPVLLLGGWMAYITADKERSYARKSATDALMQVARRIEGEIAREMQIAETLANSRALDRDDLNDFYQEAARLVSIRPLWETASLTKPDQRQVLNVLRPLGEPLGPISDPESFTAAVRLRGPVLGGLGPFQAAIGKRLVSLRIPVMRDGELRYTSPLVSCLTRSARFWPRRDCRPDGPERWSMQARTSWPARPIRSRRREVRRRPRYRRPLHAADRVRYAR